MITPVLRKHTKQYHHKSRFTRYLQYFRDVGPSHIVQSRHWALRGLSAKARNWVGESLFLRGI